MLEESARPASQQSTSVGVTPLSWRPDAIAALLALGAIGTGVAYVMNYRIISDDGPVLASAVTYLLPVVAVILGYAVLNEAITLQFGAGVLIVLLGVAVARRQTAPPQTPAQSTTGARPE